MVDGLALVLEDQALRFRLLCQLISLEVGLVVRVPYFRLGEFFVGHGRWGRRMGFDSDGWPRWCRRSLGAKRATATDDSAQEKINAMKAAAEARAAEDTSSIQVAEGAFETPRQALERPQPL